MVISNFQSFCPIVLLSVLVSGFFQTPSGESELQLRLRRNFGYSSGTGTIQGTFTMTATGPEDLDRVIFSIDDQPIGEAEDAPFQLRFFTDNYPFGEHTLSATGYTSSGRQISSQDVHVRFVSAAEGWQAGLQFILPLLVVVGGALLLALLIPTVFLRGKKVDLPPGTPRNYGFFGGAICKNCQRPFSLHIYGLNAALGKFDRCPYCGKWGLQRRLDINTLKAAEEAELLADEGRGIPSEGEKKADLERELDDSRFVDL